MQVYPSMWRTTCTPPATPDWVNVPNTSAARATVNPRILDLLRQHCLTGCIANLRRYGRLPLPNGLTRSDPVVLEHLLRNIWHRLSHQLVVACRGESRAAWAKVVIASGIENGRAGHGIVTLTLDRCHGAH